MTWKTILLSADAGEDCARRTELACDLAAAFGARLVGVAGSAPMPLPMGDPYTGGAMMGEALGLFRDMAEAEVAAALKAFHAIAAAYGLEGEWRGRAGWPADLIAQEARIADVVVLGRHSALAPARAADPADVLLAIGRPILVVPPMPPRDPLGMPAVLAWTDSRETQRAAAAALPLLRRASFVSVVAVHRGAAASESDQKAVADVAGWLSRHGIDARPTVRAARSDIAGEIIAAADDIGAGLIVAGGYGHARLREAVLGGVTQELLNDAPVCLLLSH